VGWRIGIVDNAIKLPFMSKIPDDLANVWENLLSRDVTLIRMTFFRLENQTRKQVLRHLDRMAYQPGWHEEQVVSAMFALDVLSSQENDDREEGAKN
jgi:hypothetical protein